MVKASFAEPPTPTTTELLNADVNEPSLAVRLYVFATSIAQPVNVATPAIAARLSLVVQTKLALPGTVSASVTVDVFPNTPDRKVNLFPPQYDREAPMGLYAFQPDPATDKYPLALISPPAHHFLNSTFVNLFANKEIEPVLEIHPIDAESRKIRDASVVERPSARALS